VSVVAGVAAAESTGAAARGAAALIARVRVVAEAAPLSRVDPGAFEVGCNVAAARKFGRVAALAADGVEVGVRRRAGGWVEAAGHDNVRFLLLGCWRRPTACKKSSRSPTTHARRVRVAYRANKGDSSHCSYLIRV